MIQLVDYMYNNNNDKFVSTFHNIRPRNGEVKLRKRVKTAEAEGNPAKKSLYLPPPQLKFEVLPRGFRDFTSRFSRSKDCGGPFENFFHTNL